MAEQRIDPRIYGAEELTPREDAQARATSPYEAPTQVPGETAVQGSALLAEGAAQVEAANREKASVLTSVGAAMTQWLPKKAWDYATAPKFEWEPGFNSATAIKGIPFTLDPEQEKFLLESRSQAEFSYKYQRVSDQRVAYEAMGDHALASTLTGAIDPGYLAIDIMGIGAARLAKLSGVSRVGQRAVAGGVSASMAYGAGKMEQEISPVSETEVVLNALANGAATALFFDAGAGKLRKVDEAHPGEALQHITQTAEKHADDAASVGKVRAEEAAVVRRETPVEPAKTPAHVDTVPAVARAADEVAVQSVPVAKATVNAGGRDFRYSEVSGKQLLDNLSAHADPMISKLAERMRELMQGDVAVRITAKKNLVQGHRAFYVPSEHAVYISAGNKPGTQLHEMAHAMTAHKLAYGLKNPNTVHGKIAREIENLREMASKAYKAEGRHADAQTHKDIQYYLHNADEFVSGVYSGSSPFVDLLARTKVGGTSIASRFVDSVRRLLGMAKGDENVLTRTLGLTERLHQERLNVSDMSGLEGGMSIMLSPSQQARIHTVGQAKEALAKRLAGKIEWSLHKTLGSFSEKAREVADILVDDPLSMHGDSVASQHRAIRADLRAKQYVYEDALKDALASRGFGLLQRILKPREASAAQAAIEREVAQEMQRRFRLSQDGLQIDKAGIPEHITKMADALDAAGEAALAEMQRSRVKGAEDIVKRSGWYSRKWDITKIEAIERRLELEGMSPKDAEKTVRSLVKDAIQAVNKWDDELAGDVAHATISRAKRKGYFEDSAWNAHQGDEAAKQVRDLLNGAGLAPARVQRVLDVITGVTDEKGKTASLKHRVDMDMQTSIRLSDGSKIAVADMIDSNLTSITERYLDGVATDSALARKGFKSNSDVLKLREDFLHSIKNPNERERASKLFDNTMSALRGLPTGDDLPAMMRNMQAVTQMVGLAASGLWQVTEYATVMMQYGALRTFGYAVQELPGIRSILGNAREATDLRNVLVRNATEDIRMRPYIQRMEDGFTIPVSDTVQLALQQAKQLVPYLNAMRYVQNHQARTVGNLMVDVFNKAVNGDANAIKTLEKYGLESHSMARITADVKLHGLDTAKWSSATWDAVRGPMTKMMDDAVLKARTGEIPAFAQFSQVGKFIFTFRNFTLAAHNKVLAGTLHRDGFSGLGLLMLYQFPLTIMATAANNTIQGKPAKDDKKLIAQSLGQMGSLGLASELFGIVSGEKQQFGSPGMIGLDRLYKLGSTAATGDAGKTGAALLNATPILSLIPGVRAIGEHLKQN